MILADSSIWIDYLRARAPDLAAKLATGRMRSHPLVIAEVALGSIRDRSQLLAWLDGIRSLPEARTSEVRALISTHRLHGRGIGYGDASLIASCLLAPGARLWTRDKRLASVADELGIGWPVAA